MNRSYPLAAIAVLLLACAAAGQADEARAKADGRAGQGAAPKPGAKTKASQAPSSKKGDADKEIKMIMLNQELNKKEQPVTQLTNIIGKSNDTRSAIIKNIK